MPKNKDGDFEDNSSSFNRYYHEFYPLIPGVLFFGCLTLLLIGFYCLYKGNFPNRDILVHDNWPVFALLALFLIFGAYVAGNVFNRLSPKDPDIFGIYHLNCQRINETPCCNVKSMPVMNYKKKNCILFLLVLIGLVDIISVLVCIQILANDLLALLWSVVLSILWYAAVSYFRSLLCCVVRKDSPDNREGSCVVKFDLMAKMTQEMLHRKQPCRVFQYLKLGFFSFSAYRFRKIIDPDFKLQFPYPHLRSYLEFHNHSKLATFVPWCWSQRGNVKSFSGTKQTINALKHRILELNDPDINLRLVQSECQIKLMSAMWHVLRVIRIPVVLFVAASVLSVFLKMFQYFQLSRCLPDAMRCRIIRDIYNVMMPRSGIPCCIILSILGAYGLYLFLRAKYEIEFSVHYMRTREVFDILDYSYLLSEKDGNAARFESVKATGELFHKEYCNEKCSLFGKVCNGADLPK